MRSNDVRKSNERKSGDASSYTTLFSGSNPRTSYGSDGATTLHCSTLLKEIAEKNPTSTADHSTYFYQTPNIRSIAEVITHDLSHEKYVAAIEQLKHSIVRIDITEATLFTGTEVFFEDVIKASKELPFHPFRICHQVPADLEKIKAFRQKKYISELIITGKISRAFKYFDARYIDLSQAQLQDDTILASMSFHKTKLSRAQFCSLIKQQVLSVKLSEQASSIDLSCTDISNLDLRSVDFSKIFLGTTQNLTGCIITVKQANYLAQAGVTTLQSATIVEGMVENSAVKNTQARSQLLTEINLDINKLEDAALKQNKITISAEALEKLFASDRFKTIDLNHYQMTRPEYEKILNKMRESDNAFHDQKYADRLKKFIPFLQQESKKYNVKKITLTNMVFQRRHIDAFDFSLLEMRDCIFNTVNFTQARCETAQFYQCQFIECQLNEIYISNYTVFEECQFENTFDPKINVVCYQYHLSDGKTTTKQLEPSEFYQAIQNSHAEKVKEQNKIPCLHRFFNKANQELGYKRTEPSCCLFPKTPTKKPRHKTLAAFQGLLKINQQIKKTNITAEVTKEFFAKSR